METAKTFGLWYLLVTAANTVIVMLWYWHLVTIAKRPLKNFRALVVMVFLPVYLVLPLTALSLVAAWVCPTKGYWDNYRYYLVATIYGKNQAMALYGVRKLEPRKFFHRGFARLRK